jgi:hypothetical protein
MTEKFEYELELTEKQIETLNNISMQTGLTCSQILEAFVRTRVFADQLSELIEDSNQSPVAYEFFVKLLNRIAERLNHNDFRLPS